VRLYSAMACKLSCEGIVKRLALSLGALAALGEGQKSKCASGEAREAEEDWGR
jgi:hypothetical protein